MFIHFWNYAASIAFTCKSVSKKDNVLLQQWLCKKKIQNFLEKHCVLTLFVNKEVIELNIRFY